MVYNRQKFVVIRHIFAALFRAKIRCSADKYLAKAYYEKMAVLFWSLPKIHVDFFSHAFLNAPLQQHIHEL